MSRAASVMLACVVLRIGRLVLILRRFAVCKLGADCRAFSASTSASTATTRRGFSACCIRCCAAVAPRWCNGHCIFVAVVVIDIAFTTNNKRLILRWLTPATYAATPAICLFTSSRAL